MSSPSIGVTKVVLTRWTMSWVIRSPSCSASRISRGEAAARRATSRASPAAAAAARRVFWPASVEEVEEDPIARNEAWERHRAGSYQPARTSATRSRGPARPTAAGSSEGRRAAVRQQGRDLGDPGWVETEERVRARPDRHRPLGVVAQREAGNPEVGGLLLDPARVSQDRAGVGLEREEVEVADGVDQRDPPAGPSPSERLAGSRVDREHHRQLAGDPGQRHPSASPSSGPSTSAGRCSVTSR